MERDQHLRELVAQGCRLLEGAGLIDWSGHISARSQADPSRFLINSRGQSRAAITAQDIVEVDLQGQQVGGTGKAPLEKFIHSAVYAARPDVQAVAHLHSPAALTLSVANKEFYPVIYQGSIFADGIPVYNDARHVDTASRGRDLAAVLGGRRVAVIRGHGSVAVADNVKALFAVCVYFERNARHLLEAYRIGTPRRLSADELHEGQETLWRPALFEKVWSYFASKSHGSPV